MSLLTDIGFLSAFFLQAVDELNDNKTLENFDNNISRLTLLIQKNQNTSASCMSSCQHTRLLLI